MNYLKFINKIKNFIIKKHDVTNADVVQSYDKMPGEFLECKWYTSLGCIDCNNNQPGLYILVGYNVHEDIETIRFIVFTENCNYYDFIMSITETFFYEPSLTIDTIKI